ncbi:MAG: GAF domain-containing protein [Chitinophagaceae bacterium]|nr:GAF domain-containing protein [Chitinophagaceae bacterium]
MKIADETMKEALRLQDLFSYEILDTSSEKEFDELVKLAAQICNCPIALIALTDSERQWFKARTGIELIETPRDQTFCAHALSNDDMLVVEDATHDSRFEDNPNVKGGIGIRFYAGAPIISPAGYRLGTICVMDRAPKKLETEKKEALRILSNQVTKLLELRVKNKELEQLAQAQIRLKNKTVQDTIRRQEKQKKYIANELHENIAQALAANRLYLQMAEESEQMRLPLIKKANQNIGKLVEEMCRLSDSIAPSTLEKMPLRELLEDLARNIRTGNHFDITLRLSGDIESIQNDPKIVLFKAVEKWMKMLSFKEDITEVRIELSVFENTILIISDNGNHHDAREIATDTATVKMENRITMLGGSAEFCHLEPEGNMLTVMI